MDSAEKRLSDHKLIQTIKQVGVSNYSLIARLTGMNAETVRYKVNKHLAKMDLSVNVNIDYGAIGFRRGLLRVKGTQANGDSWLDQAKYLTFAGKKMGSNEFICMYAIPPKFKKKYMDLYDSMKHSGAIDDFEASEIFWVRNPPLRSEFYDFNEKRWIVDWNSVDMTFHEIGVTSMSQDTEDTIDLFDLVILKHIQENPTTSITKIAKDMKLNPRTARYHYFEHVLKNKLILGFDVTWARKNERKPGEVMQIIYSATDLNEEQKNLACKVFNRIPFTWLEAGGQNRYLAILDIPMINFHETVAYVERNTELIRGMLEMTMLDPSKTRLFKVPDEMFDKKRGWCLTSSVDMSADSNPEQLRSA